MLSRNTAFKPLCSSASAFVAARDSARCRHRRRAALLRAASSTWISLTRSSDATDSASDIIPLPRTAPRLDLNPASVEKCRKSHDVPGLDFVQGDAQNLPFPDESFDAVINVEASHQYPDFGRFLAEVVRVLRPGGYFLYTDNRRPQAADWWDTALAMAPLRQISQRSILDEAKRGLAANTQRSHELLSRRVSPILARAIRYATGLMDRDLRRDGGISYRLYCFVKDDA